MEENHRITTKEHLFFDLDHTLWDYEKNSAETLVDLFQKYELGRHGLGADQFLEGFTRVNDEIWDKYHHGLVNKNAIRTERFPRLFQELDLPADGLASMVQEEYLTICPTKPYVITGSHEVLKNLKKSYHLHIITNGFDEIQGTKLAAGHLTEYFEEVITSGKAGIQKPESGIFTYALKITGASRANALMIGDNPLTDIEGAYRAGIDQVFYNPEQLACAITPTYEIKDLRELLDILAW